MTFTVPESLKEIIAEVVEKVVNEVLEKIEQDYKNIETVFIEAFVAGDIIKNIVDKYQGNLALDYRDGCFQLTVVVNNN